MRRWVAENDLTLHPTKTKIVDAGTEGFDFLGYHFRGKLRLPRDKSPKKFKDAVRDKTKRTNGQSMPATCSRLVDNCVDGSLIFTIVTGGSFANSMGGYEVVCTAFCASGNAAAVEVEAKTTNCGLTVSSTNKGCIALAKPMFVSLILTKVTPSTGEPDAETRPSGLEGGEADSTGLPYPYRNTLA